LKNGLPVSSCRFEKRADQYVVNGGMARRKCLAGGIASDDITTIPDGVGPMEKSKILRSQLLAELRFPADAKLIVYLGSLTKQKRVKELIWAIDQLKAVGSNGRLLIIGEGPLRTALERYCWLNRVEDQVRFLGFRNDIPRLLSHVDVLWQACAHEGQSNAILEAMGMGLPVVAADALGNRELVVAGETGYLVPMNERAGFARCTLPLLENSELAARLGAAGRRRAMEFHRIEDTLRRYAELYRYLLE
jgi:glycosyltransferase involved in cell wall biosynthesis